MSGRPRILVIDDTEANRALTARQLDKLGFDADVAGSGAVALDLLCRHAYAMILVDRRIPEMDGIEFAALLREREAGAPDRTPVVMMTADPPTEQDGIGLAGLLDGFLVKPVTLAELSAILPGRTASAPAPSASPPDEAAPIDIASFARLMGDAEPATVTRVIERFCRSFAEVQARLERAVAAQDRVEIAAIGHAGKGAAATAAATGLAAQMARLMALAPAGAWAEIERCAGRSAAELDRVRRFVETGAAGDPDRGWT